MEHLYRQNITHALKILRRCIPGIQDRLRLGRNKDIAAWTQIVDGKLLTRLSPDFPIMATICGGGSSGKSSLFNSMVGEHLSPVGGSAGLNRRVLASMHRKIFERSNILSALFEPFGSLPDPLKDTKDLTVSGHPLYVLSDAVPQNLVLMDTPDFDTGAKGTYINRDITLKALESSDILIYVFTNANYNNRENTDFISEMLTGIGMRKCFLVYRVYPSFETEEVCEHAMTVARNLYGNDADRYLLGIYRADEDNAVAAGKRFMALHPVRKTDPSFITALQSMDSRELRLELLSSILKDVLIMAGDFLEHARTSRDELRLYLDALQTAQSHCVHEALKHFPMDRVVKRFVEIWTLTDPPYVKAMRKTGKVVEFPFKVLLDTPKKVKDIFSGSKNIEPKQDVTDKVDEDLVTAVNNMHYKTVNPEISVYANLKDPVTRQMREAVERIRADKGLNGNHNPRIEATEKQVSLTFFVSAHPVVFQEQEKLRNRDWKSVLESILSRRDVIVDLSKGIDQELNNLAKSFRSKMGIWTKIRQTFSAFLNVVPATVAVTYILSTGDPLGAVGIKVKLTGLFGLHDLYALVAIPATTGLKRADQKQLDDMLGPIVQAWLNNKLKEVKDLFEQEITGGIIRAAKDAVDEADTLINQIEANIETCGKAMTS
jgi:Dynamin family